jgi:hypothetical protein
MSDVVVSAQLVISAHDATLGAALLAGLERAS